jgi:hypothetical protein
MEAYQPWLTIDDISIPGTSNPLPKHPKKFLPKYDLDDGVLPEYHIKQFMISLNLMNVEHEDVVSRLFLHTLKGKASKWFFNLAPRSVTSWQQFEETFMAQFSDEETSGLLFLYLLGIRMNEKEKFKYFNQRFITLLNRIPIKPTEAVQIEYYIVAFPPNIDMFVKNQEKQNLVDNFVEAFKVEKDLEAISNYLGDEENEVSMESDMERVISQLQDEIKNMKTNKGEGKKPFKKRNSTNTSPKVPPTLGINLEDFVMDNFCRTHCACHFEKTCPQFINSFKALLLPPKTPEKENKGVKEDNSEDEKGEAKELKEGEHLSNLDLVSD